MRLDSLIRLIESADFMSFRELALRCLSIKGYKEIALSDGWRDGGTDVRFFEMPPNPTPIAFQITVEKGWGSKLRLDAIKVKKDLNISYLVLLSSRRIAEAEFQGVAEKIWRDYEVVVSRIDSQNIATTFYMAQRSNDVLTILGIDTGQSIPSRGRNIRNDAAFSFMFFGKDMSDFRESAIESSIIAVAMDSRSGIKREALELKVMEVLNFKSGQHHQVLRVIDKMIQCGQLCGPSDKLTLSSVLCTATEVMRKLNNIEWQDLSNKVECAIKAAASNLEIPLDILDGILELLGAILVDSAQAARADMDGTRNGSILDDRIKSQMRQLYSRFDALGIGGVRKQNELVQGLADLAANSPLGANLMAGELFLALSCGNTSQLVRALGARMKIEVFLDASVAIPMLTCLLFGPGKRRFSIAARHVYDEIQRHDQICVVPRDYLEEIATHLLDAFYKYRHVISADPDLSGSENAFVSYYVSTKSNENALSYDEYLKTLGVDNKIRTIGFYAARDALMPKIQRLFNVYDIKVRNLALSSKNVMRKSEMSISYAINELKLVRSDVLIRHDTRTLAYLNERNADADFVYVLCTWDNLHFWVKSHEPSEWLALNPGTLGDILALALPSEEGAYVASPLIVAKSLSEQAIESGARVWDKLVEIERGRFQDGSLLLQAREFKEEYIKACQEGRETEDVGVAWTRWKEAHYTA